MTTLSRYEQLILLLTQIAPLPSDEDGLIIFHADKPPASDSRAQAALRRALSSWRAAMYEAGSDALAADLALDQFEADLKELDALLEDPTEQERADLYQALTR